MKNLLLLIGLMISGSLLFAQNKDTTAKAIGVLKNTSGDGMVKQNDIIQNISKAKDLSMFSAFVTEANLMETLKSKGPITVFVPVNEAFDQLAAGRVDSLSKSTHVWELTYILTYHAIAGKYKAKDIAKEINGHKGLATFTTLAGAKLTAKIDANRNIVLVDDNGGECVINQFDIEQNNGIIHIVNKVLLPKPKVI